VNAAVLVPLNLVGYLLDDDVAFLKVIDALPVILLAPLEVDDGIGVLPGEYFGLEDIENQVGFFLQAMDHRGVPGFFCKAEDNGSFHG
jgi:hypothetical protein